METQQSEIEGINQMQAKIVKLELENSQLSNINKSLEIEITKAVN